MYVLLRKRRNKEKTKTQNQRTVRLKIGELHDIAVPKDDKEEEKEEQYGETTRCENMNKKNQTRERDNNNKK